MVKFLWDECVAHDFVRYIYKIENYVIISKPNLTYQKANDILLKYKVEEKIKLFTIFILHCSAKFITEQVSLEFKIKLLLIFILKLGNPENKTVQQQQEL